MTNDRALRLGRGRNVIMCKKLALGFVAATLVCSAAVAQEVTLRGVTAFAEKTTYSRGFEKFIERVNAEGKGKIQINYIGGPKAMPPFEVGKALQSGVIDIQIPRVPSPPTSFRILTLRRPPRSRCRSCARMVATTT